MDNYYEILGVDSDCSLTDIKKSFRRKAKAIHPDLSNSSTDTAHLRLLIKAYEVLSDPPRRTEYDRIHKIRKKESFTYADFLRQRTADKHCQAKLIFYDLLHNNPNEAIVIYEKAFMEEEYALVTEMDREDYMDCSFLLSEEYERRGDLRIAYRFLREIVLLEQEKPYFKHFFQEVILRLRMLTCFKMPGKIDNETVIGYLHELIDFNFSDKDTAFFLKKAAEIFAELGRYDEAVNYLQKGLQLDGKLSGIKKLQEKLEQQRA